MGASIPCSWKCLWMFCWVFVTDVNALSLEDSLESGRFSGKEHANTAVIRSDSLSSSQNNWTVVHKQTSKDCWPWKVSQNPRLIVVVRWYIRQKLYPLLATLDSAASLAKEAIAVTIVDTQPIPVNTTKRGNLSYVELMRQISSCSALFPWLRIQGLKAPVLPPNMENLWGYGQTDWVLQQLQDVEEWDHIMFTNGDNIYSKYLLKKTLDARRSGYALIAFDFVHHYAVRNNPIKVKINTLKLGQNDLGSMIFHRGVVGRKEERCFCGLTFLKASKYYKWHNEDHGLMKMTQRCSNYSQIIIHEVLFNHQ